MSTIQWERVKELFHAALERPANERGDFLGEVCAGEPELRAEVESLLSVHAEDDTFLAEPAPGVAELADGRSVLAGCVVGAYRLEREIGRGGMGVVYLARRAHGDFEQRVAVKLVAGAPWASGFVERFLDERRILASLEHENIARLLDGGSTPEGLPYLVMEYVEGDPIDRFCDRRALAIDRRLALFRSVCGAVQFAHQKLVVHRDIKASNILVTADGVPKLLDFGIAKLLEAGRATDVTRWTLAGLRPMTPEYASPEQLRGEPLTTASDVYSLGVLLYLLLTGRLPRSLAGRAREEAAELLGQSDPRKPSVAVLEPVAGAGEGEGTTAVGLAESRGGTPRALHRRLRGDLDNIALKALAPEPRQRYASADQLAEDLRRHLAGLPVVARGQSLGYRAGKFARRNRWGIAAAALLLASLGAGAAATLRQARIADGERRVAEERERQAHEVTDLLVDLFEVSDPASAAGRTVTAREVLDAGARRVASELASQPLTQAALLTVIGRVYSNLGLREEAAKLVERGLELRRAHLGEESLAVAESLEVLGDVNLAYRSFRKCEGLFRGAAAILDRISPSDDARIGRAKTGLALCLRYQELPEQLPEADALSREAVSRLEGGEDRDALFTALGARATILQARGFGSQARELYADLLERQRKAFGPEHPALVETLNDLALLLKKGGELEPAEQHYREALAIALRALGESHADTLMVMHNLAALLGARGEWEEADGLRRRILALDRAALPPGHWMIGEDLLDLGATLAARERHAEAVPVLRESLATFRHGLPPGHPKVAGAQGALAVSLLALGQEREAGDLLDSTLAIYSSVEPLHPVYLRLLGRYADELEAIGRGAEAARCRAVVERRRTAAARP